MFNFFVLPSLAAFCPLVFDKKRDVEKHVRRIAPGLGVAAVDVPTGEPGEADTVAAGFDVDCDRLRGAFERQG